MNFFLFFLFLLPGICWSEIQVVELQWRQFSCDERCGTLLEKQLRNIPEVAEVSMDQAAGLARLRWKPYKAFRFPPINVAIHALGPDLLKVRLRVRGTVEKKNESWVLRSIGDESQLTLLPNIDPQPGQTVVEDSPYGRRFSKGLTEKLTKAQNEFYVVTVQGPLLNPVTLPPYQIVIQDITLSELDTK